MIGHMSEMIIPAMRPVGGNSLVSCCDKLECMNLTYSQHGVIDERV